MRRTDVTFVFVFEFPSQFKVEWSFFQVTDKDQLEIHAYPDADLARTFDTARATSGGFVELKGLNNQFPLDWFSKRQTATAHSTTG